MSAENIRQPRWKTVEYTKSQINKAGDIIRQGDITEAERKSTVDVIDNWLAFHV